MISQKLEQQRSARTVRRLAGRRLIQRGPALVRARLALFGMLRDIRRQVRRAVRRRRGVGGREERKCRQDCDAKHGGGREETEHNST